MGPLAGLTVVELAGIGPAPMTAMMLGDMGADVVRVERLQPAPLDNLVDRKYAVQNRNRRSIALDLRRPEGVDAVLRLVEKADALIEPFRPGVAERLGVGPEVCKARNKRLVYGRMTGWGQEGPLAQSAGHDINYIALTGALHCIGRKGERPVPPLNLLGDYGGGGMLLAFGMLCGLIEAMKSGQGQVVDAAMVDGTTLLFSTIFGLHSGGYWRGERGTNVLDTGAHFYNTYETSDGKYVSIGSIEPQFYSLLLEKLGLDGRHLPRQMDIESWRGMEERFGSLFKSRTRDEWCRILEGTDVCFAPVLSIDEAPRHSHAVAREAYVTVGGALQPAPAPRFSRSHTEVPRVTPVLGEHTDEVLRECGFTPLEVEKLRTDGVVA